MTSAYLTLIPRDWNEARRDELRGILGQLVTIRGRIGKDDQGLSWACLNIEDAEADIRGEIERLTDEIGDEIDWKGLGAAG